jgi:type I thyroxine 5'-deiodinase
MRFSVPQLHALQQEFTDKMEFLCIYIAEAHATDEWPISSARSSITGTPVNYRQAQSDEERIQAAKQFVKDYKFEFHTVIDLISNPFEELFAAWPLRYFVIHKEKLVFKAQPENSTYEFSELHDFLLETAKSIP